MMNSKIQKSFIIIELTPKNDSFIEGAEKSYFLRDLLFNILIFCIMGEGIDIAITGLVLLGYKMGS